jgi:hypothetical protein
MLASLKIQFLGEIVDGLFEVHDEKQSAKQYEFAVEQPTKLIPDWQSRAKQANSLIKPLFNRPTNCSPAETVTPT